MEFTLKLAHLPGLEMEQCKRFQVILKEQFFLLSSTKVGIICHTVSTIEIRCFGFDF